MQRSRGLKSRSRKKMTKVQRPGRTNPITNRLQRFEEGDLVHITIMVKPVKLSDKKEKLT